MYVLKALTEIVSMCNLHAILLSKITPRYFTLFTNGMFCTFSVRRDAVFFGEKSRSSESYPH
jgi:hypothetical protein